MSGFRADVQTVAVIGAGSAGQEFARLCLGAGLTVVLEDVMPANLRNARHVLLAAATGSAGNLITVLTVEDAVREADLAIDFVPDELESKLEIFSMIDRMAPPRTILCTPSDALSITDLASCTYRPGQCFALRGFEVAMSGRGSAELVSTANADVLVRDSIEALLRRLSIRTRTAADSLAPQLTRNG